MIDNQDSQDLSIEGNNDIEKEKKDANENNPVIEEEIEEEPEEENVIISEEERIELFIAKLDSSEKQHLIFSLLYLASRPVFFDEISRIIPFSSTEEFEQVVFPIINRINEELNSRLAPYYVKIIKDKHQLHLVLKKDILDKISFSPHIFEPEKLKISREKMKILSFITYRTIIRHTLAPIEDILTKFGVSGINFTNDLEKEGFVYQRRLEIEGKGKIVVYELSNKFLETMNFPREPLEVSGYLREYFTNYLVDEDEDKDDDLYEDEEVIES